MKLLKLLIILLFMQLFLFTSLFAQEEGSSNTDSSGAAQSSSIDTKPAKNEDEGLVKEKENTQAPDSTKKEKTESNTDAPKKTSTKKKPEVKAVQKTEDVKPEEIKPEEAKPEEIKTDKPDTVKIDDGLLIDDGNFKYKRIPEIKLIEKAPELPEKNIAVETPAENESDKKQERSYVDIWKILIVLIIVGIFILYMSMASGSAKKRSRISKSRKVLNSYRK